MYRHLVVFLTVLCLLAGVAVQAELVTPLSERLVAVETETTGKTREEALTLARQEAALATAGRVLLESRLVRADDLLEKYLRNYADNFVVGVEILQDTFTGGSTAIAARVFVDYKALHDDLTEKRFLYKPAYRPMVTAFIEEKLDGKKIEEPARSIVLAAIEGQGMKTYQGTITDPPVDSNVSLDPLLLDSAVVACERRNVEIIFTGSSSTTLREEKKLYYDQYYFYDCEMELQMIRVDTGEVIHKARATGSASSREPADAITQAIERAAGVIAPEFSAVYKEVWPDLVQFDADYEILLTGTDSDLTRVVMQHLQQLSPDTKVYLRKSLFEKSAIISISTSATRERVIETIRSTPFPTLHIVREAGENKLEVQVSS